MKLFTKRFSLSLALAWAVFTSAAPAGDWCAALHYGGWQPNWNPQCICNNCGRCKEDKRLNHFWHDYYSSLSRYYCSLSHIDWVAYYKNHACPNYQNLGCTGQGIIQYNPVVVVPGMRPLQPCEPCMCSSPCCP